MRSAAARKEDLMMRWLVPLCLLLAATSAARAGEVAGTWSAHLSEKRPGKLQLSLRIDGDGQT